MSVMLMLSPEKIKSYLFIIIIYLKYEIVEFQVAL